MKDKLDHKLDRQFVKLIRKAMQLNLLPKVEGKNIIKELTK